MVEQTKKDTLINGAKRVVKLRREWLRDANYALTMVKGFPEDIRAFGGCEANADGSDKNISVNYMLPYVTDEDQKTELLGQIMSMWAKFGLVWDKNAKLSYGTKDTFYLNGYMPVPNSVNGDEKISVTITNMDKPPLCRLVEKKEFKEVTTYEAVCDEESFAQEVAVTQS